jgi:pimeloyl-ACP methyl ester carboxylesterase
MSVTEVRVPLPDGNTTSEQAEAMLAAAPERFLLGGTAYGGCLALEIAARAAPGRVAGLVLMNCQPGAHPDPSGIEATLARVRGGAFTAELDALACAAVPAGGAARACFLAMGRDAGPDRFLRDFAASAARRDHWATLPHLACPALLLWGEADGFVVPEVGRRMAGLMPSARYVGLSGCGHLPTLERAERAAAEIRMWLETEIP